MSGDTVTMTILELSTLQTQLVQYKQDKFDAEESLSKYKRDFDRAAAELQKKDQEIKKLSDLMKGSKDKAPLLVLQEENANLEQTIAQMSQENREQQTAMKANIKQLFQQNADLQSKITDLEKASATTNKTPSLDPALVAQHQEALRKLSEVEKKLEHEKATNSTLKSEYEKKITELVTKTSDEIAQLKSKADSHERQAMELAARCEQLTTYKATLSAQVKDATAQVATIDGLNKKITTLEAVKMQLEQKTSELVKAAEAQTSKHSAELAQLKSHHQASLASIQTENAEDAQNRISTLAQEIEQLRDTTAKQLEELSQLRPKAEESDRHKQSSEELKAQIVELHASHDSAKAKGQSELAALASERAALEAEGKTLASSLSTLKEELETLRKTTQESARAQSTQFALEKAELETKQVSFESDLRSAKAEIDDLTAQVLKATSSSSQALQQSQSEASALKEKVTTMEKEKEALANDMTALLKEKDTLTKEKETLINEKAGLVKAKDAFVKEKESWVTEKAALLKDKSDLEEKLIRDSTSSIQKIDELTEQYQQLRKAHDSVKGSAGQTQAELQQREKERDEALAHVTQLTEEKKAHDSAMKKQKAKFTKKNKECEELQAKAKDLEGQVAQLAEIDSLKDSQLENIKTGMIQMSEELKKYEEAEKDSGKHKSELEDKVKALEATLHLASAERDRLKDKQSGSEFELTQLRVDHNALKEKQKDTAIQLGKLTSALEEEKAETSRLKAQLTEEAKKTAYTEAKLAKAKEELGQESLALHKEKEAVLALEQEKAALHAEKKLAEEEKTKLEAKIVEQEANIGAFQQKLTDMDMEYKIAEKQNLRTLKELQTRVRQLQGEGLTRTNSSSNLTLPSSPVAVTPVGTPIRTPSQSSLAGPATPSTPSKRGDVASTAPNVLQADIDSMGVRIGQLSEQNFKLEVKVSALLEEIASLNAELEDKSRLIRQQSTMLRGQARGPASGQTTHRQPEPPKSASALDGITSFFGGSKPNLASEVNATMGSVLEEALMKNMQLQDAMALLGKEVEDLRQETERYKTQIQRMKTGELDVRSLPSLLSKDSTTSSPAQRTK